MEASFGQGRRICSGGLVFHMMEQDSLQAAHNGSPHIDI